MTNSEITSPLALTIVSRMRNARRNAQSFERMGSDYSASVEMWCQTYIQLCAILQDQIKSAGDEWWELVRTLEAEWE